MQTDSEAIRVLMARWPYFEISYRPPHLYCLTLDAEPISGCRYLRFYSYTKHECWRNAIRYMRRIPTLYGGLRDS